MNELETAELLSVLSAMDGRSVSDETVSVWQTMLAPFTAAEASRALHHVCANRTDYVRPAHVIQRIKAEREAQARERSLAEAKVNARGVNTRGAPPWFHERVRIATQVSAETRARGEIPTDAAVHAETSHRMTAAQRDLRSAA